jgi:hypothetical protein
MHTNKEALEEAGVDISSDFYLRYYNIRDFNGLQSDNFNLETRIKCDRPTGDKILRTVACPSMVITIITEEDVFYVPVSSKGCVSELELLIGEVYKSGKDNDLSRLGADVYEWQTLQIKNQNKKCTIFLNGSPVHTLTYKKDFGEIKGLIYTFTGVGSVDFIRMTNSKGEVAYEDEFE